MELAPFTKAVAAWQGKLTATRLPKWADFDMRDFIGWHGNLCLSDILESKKDARYRIWGSNMTNVFGHDATGMYLSEANMDFTKQDQNLLYDFAVSKQIMKSGGVMDWHDKEYMYLTFLRLPLSESGQDVDRYITLFHERSATDGDGI